MQTLTALTGCVGGGSTTSTGIRWDIWEDVYLNVQIDYDWESKPSPGNEKDDTTILIGAGVALD